MEAAKMRQAMEASIQERDQRRQMEEQARPELTNLSEERLRKRFAGSAVLEKLTGLLPGGVLFCDNQPVFGLIKCPLVALLRLEERCCKWWPGQGTIQYFSTFAGELVVYRAVVGSAQGGVCLHIYLLPCMHYFHQL